MNVKKANVEKNLLKKLTNASATTEKTPTNCEKIAKPSTSILCYGYYR